MVFLFSLTLFVSAGLLFSVQPMIGKMILPKLGGSPAVWNTCMVFFQAALLIGYLYAHLLTRLSRRWQALVHLGVICLPFLLLPIHISNKAIMAIPSETNPIPWLIGFLVMATALPFIVVSTTAPLLQKWFSITRHHHAHDPYFLYSASNLGSMIGLLMYPLLVEPRLNLMQQSLFWTVGYGCLAVLILCCAFVTLRLKIDPSKANEQPLQNYHMNSFSHTIRERKVNTEDNTHDSKEDEWPHDTEGITYLRLLRWVLFAFIPSSLLLGVTTFLTTDIAPFPLLWVVPLALYLLSFILVFARRPIMPPYWFGRVLSLCAVVLLIVFIVKANHPAWLIIILNLLLFVTAAMIFHGELARDRPPPSRLTEFYLCLSVGGVLGGLFNAIVAPLLFDNILELPAVMLLACALRPTGRKSDGTKAAFAIRWRDAAWAMGIGLLTVGLIYTVLGVSLSREGFSLLFIFAVPALMAYRFVRNPMRFALSLLVILVAGLLFMDAHERTLIVHRNFFGVIRVTDYAEGKYRLFFHGSTLHGLQSLEPSRQGEALSYFHHSGPIGQVFDIVNASSSSLSIGVVGLGVGSLAAYAKPTQDWTFYEINPAVVQIARDPQMFTFLKNNHARSFTIILGDARLRLQDAENQQYDLLVLDAFSSDSIPIHLVTMEALQLYLQALSNDGILAFNITNRRLDLKPVFANLAHDANLIGLIRNDYQINIDDQNKGKARSVWVVMARNKNSLAPLFKDTRWELLRPDTTMGVWTDDFSNILSVVKWRR